MNYPYPPLVSLLQFRCAPNEYERVKTLYLSSLKGGDPSAVSEYWEILPGYTYAFCPICRARYHEPADTYSIDGWGMYPDLKKTLYDIYSTYPRCPHFLGIHVFLNLHGNLPTEITYLENNTGEVPYLTPWFFPIDIESYAVLHALPICRIEAGVSVELVQPGTPASHALPICRIEADQFVPRYTVFSLTYFSQQPKEVLRRHYAEEAEHAKRDPEYYPTTVLPAPGYPVRLDEALYDLSAWAGRGQLGWLDFTQADTPLRIGAGLQLPEIYRDIQGRRNTYVWRKGKIHHW